MCNMKNITKATCRTGTILPAHMVHLIYDITATGGCGCTLMGFVLLNYYDHYQQTVVGLPEAYLRVNL